MRCFLCFVVLLSGFVFAQISAQSLSIDEEFSADTARVEQKIKDMLDKDWSTAGMLEASKVEETEYDTLLNKYYQILWKQLDADGQKALRQTQRNWITLRDSEKDLVRALYSKTYQEMGGGTIWGVVAAGARTNITKRRVLEIFRYIKFSDIGGK